MTDLPWLKVTDATIEFSQTRVLNGVSFELLKGEIGCLLGSSGCGKTTLLRSIAGFEKLHAGEVMVNQRVLSGQRKHVAPEQRHIGMVFQDYALLLVLSIRKFQCCLFKPCLG